MRDRRELTQICEGRGASRCARTFQPGNSSISRRVKTMGHGSLLLVVVQDDRAITSASRASASPKRLSSVTCYRQHFRAHRGRPREMAGAASPRTERAPGSAGCSKAMPV